MWLIIVLFFITCLFVQQYYWANKMIGKSFNEAREIYNDDATSQRERRLVESKLTAYQIYAINCVFIGTFVGTLFFIMVFNYTR